MGGPLDPYITLEEITLEQFKEWFPVDFIKQLSRLFMCGNLGDAIVAKDTLEIFKYLRSINKDMSLALNTNGSARSVEWWRELASLDVLVVFGIDGLKDTHHLYRINTDFEKIIENAKAFIEAGGKARWDMLVFKHNQHQVEECKQLSKDLGFDEFYIKHTSRFKDGKLNVINDQGKTIHILYPTDRSHDMIEKVEKAKQEQLPKITCKAKAVSEIYVSATGIVSPCCWLDVEWMQPTSTSRIDYMDKIGEFPNLNTKSLKEIFDSNYFTKIESCWTTTGLKECSKQCGSFDKQREQYEV